MKKRILILISIISLMLPVKVLAESGKIRASSNQSTVYLNNSFNVTVTVSSSGLLGSWQYNLTYDKDKLTLLSGNTSIADFGDGSSKTKTYSYSFRAIKEGKASIGVSSAKIADWQTESFIETSTGGTTVTISKPVNIVYSSNNNLSSLTVEDYELEPTFDKNTLEYTITTLPGITSIKVSAKASDSKASISGTGSLEVIEGENLFPIKVIAENGAAKTYNIKVIVPEKDPIKINYNGEPVNIMRKLPEELPINFTETTILIENEEVPALYNEKMKLNIIYVSDEEGNYNFYTFENNKIGIKFITISSNGINIYLNESTKKIKGLTDAILKLNDENINCYQINNDSKYYIIYGTNTLTNKSNYYSYDSKNQTLQLFNEEDYLYLLENADKLTLPLYILAASSVILILIIILQSSNQKKYKKINKKEEQPKEIKIESKEDKNKKETKKTKKD